MNNVIIQTEKSFIRLNGGFGHFLPRTRQKQFIFRHLISTLNPNPSSSEW